MENITEKLNVSDIQHFSVGDGPGIRTTVFLKGCNLRCPWCHNPETWLAETQILHYKAAKTDVTYGRLMTVDEVFTDAAADIDFYRQSDGGVTISGGECMLQAGAVAALLKMLKSAGINTIIDTAGNVDFELFEKVNPYVDMYLYDLKTADAEKYRSIGGNIEKTVDNVTRLVKLGGRVIIRIPFIPDFNDSDGDCKALADLILKTGAENVDLLPFHRLGAGKYEALGRKYAYADVKPMTVAYAEGKLHFFSERGLNAQVEH